MCKKNGQHPKFSLIDPTNNTITIDLLAGNKSNLFELDIELRNIDDQTYVGSSRATGYGSFFYRFLSDFIYIKCPTILHIEMF